MGPISDKGLEDRNHVKQFYTDHHTDIAEDYAPYSEGHVTMHETVRDRSKRTRIGGVVCVVTLHNNNQ